MCRVNLHFSFKGILDCRKDFNRFVKNKWEMRWIQDFGKMFGSLINLLSVKFPRLYNVNFNFNITVVKALVEGWNGNKV